jgi:hypothetical protein
MLNPVIYSVLHRHRPSLVCSIPAIKLTRNKNNTNWALFCYYLPYLTAKVICDPRSLSLGSGNPATITTKISFFSFWQWNDVDRVGSAKNFNNQV